MLRSEPRELIRVDLTAAKSPPNLNNLTARWKLRDTDQINCFAVWAEVSLTSGVRLTTKRTTSWSPVIYRLNPFREEQGELEFKLTLTEASNYWTAALSNDHAQEAQSYSPAVASTVLLAQAKANVDLSDHLQRVGLMAAP
jgi:hypothetical protein